MGSSPTRLVIESLLVALDAFPTKEVLGAVRADELNHMIGNSIAPLATFDCFVFGHLSHSQFQPLSNITPAIPKHRDTTACH
jgi:hypothetical protein